MTDIVERLRAIRDGEEIERLATEIEEMQDDVQMLWDAVAEKNAEIERLRNDLVGLHELRAEELNKTPKDDADKHYQAAMAMSEKHRKNWVEASQEVTRLREAIKVIRDAMAALDEQVAK